MPAIRLLHGLRAPRVEGRVGGIGHHAELLQSRQDFAKHFDALGRHLLAERCEAGQAATGPREALKKIGIALHGGQRHRHDGDLSFLHNRTRRGRAWREQHIDRPGYQFVDQGEPTGDVAISRARIDDDATPREVAEVGHCLAELGELAVVNVGRRKTDKTHNWNALLLSKRDPWRQRRHAQSTKKLPPSHLTAAFIRKRRSDHSDVRYASRADFTSPRQR
jgi:hypothetical protein